MRIKGDYTSKVLFLAYCKCPIHISNEEGGDNDVDVSSNAQILPFGCFRRDERELLLSIN